MFWAFLHLTFPLSGAAFACGRYCCKQWLGWAVVAGFLFRWQAIPTYLQYESGATYMTSPWCQIRVGSLYIIQLSRSIHTVVNTPQEGWCSEWRLTQFYWVRISKEGALHSNKFLRFLLLLRFVNHCLGDQFEEKNIPEGKKWGNSF